MRILLPRIPTTLLKAAFLIGGCAVLAHLSGCTTVQNFCDEKPAVCATVGAALVAGAIGTVMFACSHGGPRVVHNTPPAPPSASCVTNPAICE